MTLTPTAAGIVLAVVAALTFLAWQGTVNGDAVIALFSTIVGGVLVARKGQRSTDAGRES